MRQEWHEERRRRSPESWLGVAAPSASGAVLACRDGLVVWSGSRVPDEIPLPHRALSIAAAPDGRLVCTGEERTTVLTGEFQIERTLQGPECPDPNHNGRYAVSASYFVHLHGSELVCRRTRDWEITARRELSPEWRRAPAALFAATETAFLMECAQEELVALVEVSSQELTLRRLPFAGAFLGFLDDGKCYVGDWDGRITVSSLPDGMKIRDFAVPLMTPVAVPDVFTAVAQQRGVAAGNAEAMFGDVFVDVAGNPAPFAIWTGSFDGRAVYALHEDGTMRLWRPASLDPYRRLKGRDPA